MTQPLPLARGRCRPAGRGGAWPAERGHARTPGLRARAPAGTRTERRPQPSCGRKRLRQRSRRSVRRVAAAGGGAQGDDATKRCSRAFTAPLAANVGAWLGQAAAGGSASGEQAENARAFWGPGRAHAALRTAASSMTLRPAQPRHFQPDSPSPATSAHLVCLLHGLVCRALPAAPFMLLPYWMPLRSQESMLEQQASQTVASLWSPPRIDGGGRSGTFHQPGCRRLSQV